VQKSNNKNKLKTSKIGITEDKITGRGGLAFYLRYVEQIGFYNLSENILGKHLTIGSKGLGVYQFVKQMLSYFIDGAYMSIESFNEKKKTKPTPHYWKTKKTKWHRLTK